MKALSSGGSNKNSVYKLFNTAKNLRTTRSVSIVRSSQLIPNTQSLKFAALLDQEVHEHTTHVNEKYE
jgi:hypothetical protein